MHRPSAPAPTAFEGATRRASTVALTMFAAAVADPPSKSELAQALSAAASAHHEYEVTALKGVRDDLWAGFYTAFVLGRLGDIAEASRLAALLEEVDAPSNWPEAAAEHLLINLRSSRPERPPCLTQRAASG